MALVANTDWYLWNYRLSLADYLRSLKAEVYLISPPGAYSHALSSQGFSWIEWQLVRRSVSPYWEILSIINLYKIYRTIKPNIVHHFTIKPVLYGSFVAWGNRIPIVVNSITGLGYLFLRDTISLQLLRAVVLSFYRLLLTKSWQFVIFENQDNRNYFIERKLVIPENTTVIEGVGVDTDKFFPSPEPEGIPVILYTGRFLWEKGIGTLVEAARLLHSQHRVRIVLVGKPDEDNPGSIPIEILSKWEKEGLIELWGWQQNMPEIYQKSHIVVLPSWGEGVPTTLLEAGSSARPVIASDVAGCREVVINGVNGFLTPPRNPRALCEAIQALISDPHLRRKMGETGRRIVLEKFSKEIIDKKTIKFYQYALEKKLSK